MSKHAHDGRPRLQPGAEHDGEVVAAALAMVLAGAESAVGGIRAEVERATGGLQGVAGAAEVRLLAEEAVERLRADVDAELRGADAAVAELRSDLAAVHAQLEQVNAAIVALETHSLRQTGGVALALSVLIAIAWKMIEG